MPADETPKTAIWGSKSEFPATWGRVVATVEATVPDFAPAVEVV